MWLKPKDKSKLMAAPPDGTRASGGWQGGWGWLLLALTGLTYYVQDCPLFWDTVQLAGKHATHYWRTDFSQLLLPEHLDSGHPPTFGLYLAVCWKLFGRNLAVSHWAMFPWLVLWLAGAWRAVGHWVPAGWQLPTVLLLLIDPVWLGQAVLVSPDIWVMAAFWWGVVGLGEHRNLFLVPATMLPALTSTRGMMLVAALFAVRVVWDVQFNRVTSIKTLLLNLLPFLPAATVGAAFLGWHYWATGWIGYHATSPWAPSFERVGASGLLKNVAVLGWRVLDFGRVVAVLVLGSGLFFVLRKRNKIAPYEQSRIQRWGSALILFSIFLLPSFLLYKGLSGHRYLLPILQWLLLGVVLIITQLKNSRWQTFFYSLVLLGLITGHRWIYPRRVSQQWDATLAHLPYQQLRRTGFAYLDEQRIPYDSVSTAFPEIGPRDWRALNGIRRGLSDKNETRTPYIWYSNVMNDFSDAELDTLARYPIEAAWNSKGIELVIYRRND